VSESLPPPFFLITVDTEADDAWTQPHRIELRNMEALPHFQQLASRYGFEPTYLITYECATRSQALDVLQPMVQAGGCEIGHHLHVWTTPPYADHHEGVDRRWLRAYQFELPEGLFRDKAATLRESIAAAFGRAPTAHRAGKWGLDSRTIRWLVENDFQVDSSVTPLVSWRGIIGREKGGPSFRSSPPQPFRWAHHDAMTPGAGLLEIPTTTDNGASAPARWLSAAMRRGIDGELLARIHRRLGGGRGLRPHPRRPATLLTDIIERRLERRAQVLNLHLHSSELTLGGSPLSRTEDDLRRVWTDLESAFAQAQRRGLRAATLSQAARDINQREDLPRRDTRTLDAPWMRQDR
jgi:hypothetical protein